MSYTNLENLCQWDDLVKEIKTKHGIISLFVNDPDSETVSRDYLLKHIRQNIDKYYFNFLPPTTVWKNHYDLKNISFEALENIAWADAYKLIPTENENIFKKKIVRQTMFLTELDSCLEKVCEYFNVYLIDAWISIVYPCFSVPLHDDLANFNGQEGFRISIPLQDPIKYQSFIIEEHYHSNIPKYHAIRFEKHEVHGLVNCSNESHYMLNITAGTL